MLCFLFFVWLVWCKYDVPQLKGHIFIFFFLKDAEDILVPRTSYFFCPVFWQHCSQCSLSALTALTSALQLHPQLC